MAKLSLVNRELKRNRLVNKFSQKRDGLRKIADNSELSDGERYSARLSLQALPRNSNPTRQRNRCALTGRPRGTFRKFGLGRIKLRELAMAGKIPGIIKASW